MSYPNQNPYGPPPGQQPGYGYPQQQPPSPYGPYPGGPMPGMQPQPQYPTVMPGGVKAARVLLFVLMRPEPHRPGARRDGAGRRQQGLAQHLAVRR